MQPDFTKLKPVVDQPNFATLKPVVSSVVETPKPGYLPSVAPGTEAFKAGIDKFITGTEQVFEGVDFNKPNPALLGRGVLNQLAGGLETVFSPITATFNTITGNKFSELFTKIGESVSQGEGLVGEANKFLTDIPAYQKFAMDNPHAEEVFSNLLTIGTSIAGGNKKPEIINAFESSLISAERVFKETSTIVEKAKDATKAKIEPRIISSTIDDWNRVGGDYVRTEKLLAQEEARLSNTKTPKSAQDAPTFLAEHGVSPKSLIGENGKFDTADLSSKLTTESVKPFETALTEQLKVVQQGQPLVQIAEVKSQAIKNIDSITNITEGDRVIMKNALNKEMIALQNKYPKGIPLDELNVQKGNYWRNTKFDSARPLQPQVNYNIGSSMKDLIEIKAGDANVIELNGILGNYYKTAKFLNGLNGRVPKLTAGQKVGRAFTKAVSVVLGSSLLGIEGGVGGFLLSKTISNILENASNPLRSYILNNLKKTNPKAYTEAIKWLGEKEAERLSRLALPAGSPQGTVNNPIVTPVTDASKVEIIPAKKTFPTQNPKTGKMQKTYLSQ